jgi:REP element-mobilizing transposase RayT
MFRYPNQIPLSVRFLFQRGRHARYLQSDVAYHIITRTRFGLFLLGPDGSKVLTALAAGVLSRARSRYRGIQLFAVAVMSNHVHLMLRGAVSEIAAFVGYFKRELSLRWGKVIGKRGLFEEGYHATAVITRAAQLRCLRYILSQGVKEDLVVRPQQWPGLHCAEALISGQPIAGTWFNGTSYGRAKHEQTRRRNPQPVRRRDHTEDAPLHFDPIPTMAHLSRRSYRAMVAKMVDDIVTEGIQRRGYDVLGVDAIIATDIMTESAVPSPPWFEQRRRMVVWDDLSDPEVKQYLDNYWRFQREFRAASVRWLAGEFDTVFPVPAFRPGIPRPVEPPGSPARVH